MLLLDHHLRTLGVFSHGDMEVKCQYCGNKAKKVMGDEIYPHRKSLWKKKFYLCKPCDAYVSCHKTANGKFRSMGQLANRALRRARVQAHEAFDPIWNTGLMHRRQAYQWLSEQLGIPVDETHIGMFSEQQCARVIEICKQNPFRRSDAK